MKILQNDYDVIVEVIYRTKSKRFSVAASKKRKNNDRKVETLSPNDVNVNESSQMYADFNVFVTTTCIKHIRTCGFEVLDAHYSDWSNTTFYISMCHPVLDIRYRLIFFLRISSHPMDNSADKSANRDRYYAEHAERLSKDYKGEVDYALKDIRINNDHFKTYSQAERFFKQQLLYLFDDYIEDE